MAVRVPVISIIVPAFNRADLTRDCLKALKTNTDGAELVLVDNGSTDETPSLYGGWDIVVRNRRNLGFGRACNQGAAVSSGQTFVFLNNDTQAGYRWLGPLAAAADEYGIAGPKLTYPDGTIQAAGARLYFDAGVLTAENLHDDRPTSNVDAVSGACLAVRRDLFARAGGFDLGYWNGYEDIDLCLTVTEDLGGRCRYVPESRVTHLESQSGPERWSGVRQNIERLNHKWSTRWQDAHKRVHEHVFAEVVPGDHRHSR